MSEDEDLIEELDEVDDSVSDEPDLLDSVGLDSRRKLEAKLEEMRLRKLTQDYDFD